MQHTYLISFALIYGGVRTKLITSCFNLFMFQSILDPPVRYKTIMNEDPETVVIGGRKNLWHPRLRVLSRSQIFYGFVITWWGLI